MGRVVLFLIVVSAVVFAVVLKTPLRTIQSAIFPEDYSASASQTQTPIKSEAAAKATKSAKTKSKSSTSVNRLEVEPNEGNLTSPVGTPVAIAEVKAPSARVSKKLLPPPTLTTSADSVALYSINSTTRGRVLGMLKRGTVVIPSLQVMDGDVNWVLVRVPELNLSGFIQTEKLVSLSGG